VIRRAWRGAVRFLGSAGLAAALLLFLGIWSMLATLIPQGEASDPAITAWASSHPIIESIVRVVGLHQAFTGFVFMVCILALVVSTALCAWRRTRLAIGRSRILRKAAAADEQSVVEGHDLEIACDHALSGPAVLSIASETLERLGIRTKRRGDLLTNVSASWSVWGSPAFHWALVALIMAILVGGLQRSEGLMGVAVGQTKADTPESYGVLHTGPLHDWRLVHRSIRVDSFDPDFKTGGIDRGPTPIVSVLDGAGRIMKTQRLYPNMPLQTGSLTIHASDYGLAATLSMVNTSGVETGRAYALVDFSEEATGGTVPVGFLVVNSDAGAPEMKIFVTVPLDGTPGQFYQGPPKGSRVRVVATSLGGKLLLDRVVGPGEDVALPVGGGSLHLIDLGWYARLSVVDDMSIPLLYAALVLALIGLTMTVVARQQIVLATVTEGPEGVSLIGSVRLWHNVPTSRSEIQGELAKALGEAGKGSTT
jgi:hypothetical protein